MLEVYGAVHEAVGDGLPVTARLAVEDSVPRRGAACAGLAEPGGSAGLEARRCEAYYRPFAACTRTMDDRAWLRPGSDTDAHGRPCWRSSPPETAMTVQLIL